MADLSFPRCGSLTRYEDVGCCSSARCIRRCRRGFAKIMICAQFLWRGTQSAGLGIRKKLRQWYSARSELHSSPELHCRWTAVFSRKLRLQLWRNWRIDLLNVVGSCQGAKWLTLGRMISYAPGMVASR